MPRFKTIAFYTDEYEAQSKELVASGKLFGIDVETVRYNNTGEWVRNAALKSSFILDMMEKYLHQEWILYVDADARFRQYPKLFDTFEGDLGVHYRRGRELLSGTIFLHNTREVRAFIMSWVIRQWKNPREWDQKILQECIKLSDINVVKIPAAYTQIFDKMAKHGKPIIEHMQASRTLRQVVEEQPEHSSVPQTIGNTRIRRGYDGTYYIIRKNVQAEAYMDEHYSRLVNQLRWIPKKHATKRIESLRPMFEGQNCYVIGKGPSLDNVKAEHFDEGPIICLNESIHFIEALGLSNQIFALQQDARLKDACYPKQGYLFVSIKAANWYEGRPRVWPYDARKYGLFLNGLSVSAAIKIAKSLGTKCFTLVSFDASVNGNLKYARTITDRSHDVKWGGKPDRFRDHRAKIEECLGNIPTEWLTPKAFVGSSSYTPQQ